MTSRLPWLFAATLLVFAGCDDAQQAPADTAQPDGTVQDTLVADTSTPDVAADQADVSVPKSCAELLRTDTTFEVSPLGPDTQIHASAAFDGEGLWVAFSQPDDFGDGGFDVFATRLRCDGTTLVEPFPLHSPTAYNELDPSIASDGTQLYAAWSIDTGRFPTNLSIIYRVLSTDGTLVGAQATKLNTTRAGQPLDTNAWLPSVATHPGGFVIAGVRGVQADMGFQSFAQRMGADASLVGEAIEGGFDPTASDNYPSAATDADGRLYLAWLRAIDAGDYSAVMTTVEPGATTASSAPIELAPGQVAGSVSITADGPRVVAATSVGGSADLDILLLDAKDPSRRLTLGKVGALDHSPGVALKEGGGAVFYYRVRSGIRNDVVVQGFTDDGTTFAALTEHVMPMTDSAGPYGPTITHVQGDVYFVAWTEGVSPAFRIKGRFVTAI